MATIPSNFNFPNSKQIPDHAILNYYNKQTYLGNTFIYATEQTIGSTSETPIMVLSNPVGNPAGYIQITINGATAYIPYWT